MNLDLNHWLIRLLVWLYKIDLHWLLCACDDPEEDAAA